MKTNVIETRSNKLNTHDINTTLAVPFITLNRIMEMPWLLKELLFNLSIKEIIVFDSSISNKDLKRKFHEQLQNFVIPSLVCFDEKISSKISSWIKHHELKVDILKFRIGDNFRHEEFCGAIKTLQLNCSSSSYDRHLKFGPILQNCETLKELLVQRMSAIELADILTNCPLLQALSISIIRIPPTIECLQLLHSKCPHIISWDVSAMLNDAMVEIITKSYPFLKKLCLYNACRRDESAMTDASLLSVARNCPDLVYLKLWEYCTAGEDDGIEWLSSTSYTEMGLIKFIQLCPKLKFFIMPDIRRYNKNSLIFTAISKYLKNLKYLRVTENSIESFDEGIEQIVMNCPNLLSLGFNKCKFMSHQSLHYIINYCSQLVELSLSGKNEIKNIDIIKAVRKWRNLKNLTLISCSRLTPQVLRCLNYCKKLIKFECINRCWLLSERDIENVIFPATLKKIVIEDEGGFDQHFYNELCRKINGMDSITYFNIEKTCLHPELEFISETYY